MAILWFVIINNSAFAEVLDAAQWTFTLRNDYRINSDITYLKANNVELKLDVYIPRNSEKPYPTLIFFHGNFSKDEMLDIYTTIRKFLNIYVID